MNGENSQNNNQECCASGDCSCKSEKNKNRGIKTTVFLAVIVAAIGVTAYSLFFKNADAGKAGCLPGASPGRLEKLTVIPELNDRLRDLDFALVVIADSAYPIPAEITGALDSALSEIKSKTEKADILYLVSGNPGYAEAIEQYTITGFPAILALGRYGDRLLIRSGITVEAITRAHKAISIVPAPCC